MVFGGQSADGCLTSAWAEAAAAGSQVQLLVQGRAASWILKD
eukprot:CAMPEP_0168506786 /NCGR_PEP_ID=MMETSP0228-20121227/77552_1 /TAXON_ID=133427 /ORGANISM="Protoceratium reticulatum, Strain CCCM 535 (=CCMP 1889)" /LENGTH=41 /DNA_ID= /DNA_START= /DNA_END= /DNA_ORIENTATION=